MSDERRYDEDDIRKIVERASLQGSQRSAASDGLTLAELQTIGTEVGLSPADIAKAAVALDTLHPDSRRALLGMPMRVDRTVFLRRLPTDQEWELLLVELRTTFAARGRDGSRGNLREWRNGNLFAYVEPLTNGCQLRLGTVKGNAVAVNGIGLVSILAALFTVATLVVPNDLAGGSGFLAVIWGMVAAGAFAFNAIRLPRWAHTREMQMERIIDRARDLLLDRPPASSAAEVESA